MESSAEQQRRLLTRRRQGQGQQRQRRKQYLEVSNQPLAVVAQRAKEDGGTARLEEQQLIKGLWGAKGSRVLGAGSAQLRSKQQLRNSRMVGWY